MGLETGEGSQLAQIPVEVPVNAPTSTSNKSLTLQEVLAMKEQNPVEALRKLQQFRHESVVVEPIDLTTEISPEMEVKLHELKRFLFDGEILTVVAEEDPVANEIFKILDELIQNGLPDPIAKYLIEFEAFFTRLVRDLAVHRQGDLQIKTDVNSMKVEWDLSRLCEKQLDDFEVKKQEISNKEKSFDEEISGYEAQIVELNQKIAEVKEKKASLASTASLPTPDAINQAVQQGLTHVEKALKIKETIGRMKHKQALIDSRLVHEKATFEEFKSRFPA